MERRRHFDDEPLRDLLAQLVQEGRDKLEEGLEKVRTFVQDRPGQALLGAFLAGVLTAVCLRRDR
jgi:hypothetical protein